MTRVSSSLPTSLKCKTCYDCTSARRRLSLLEKAISCNNTNVSNTPAILEEIVMARISQQWASETRFNNRCTMHKKMIFLANPLLSTSFSIGIKLSLVHMKSSIFINRDPSQSTTFKSSLIIANRDVATCTQQLSLMWSLLARGENSLQWYQSNIHAILEETAMTRTTQPQATEKRL